MKTVLIIVGILLLAGSAEAGWGDVTFDGRTTAYDAALILAHLEGNITLEPWRLYYADVDADGDVDLRDVEWIMLYSARLIYLFERHMIGWPIWIRYHPLIVPLWWWDFTANPIL